MMKSTFELQPTYISGLTVLQRVPFLDSRGYLERLFCVSALHPIYGDRAIVQINHTLTLQTGTVRGMHFQREPHSEFKLVSCLRGEVFDVAVDLRPGSPTFGKWFGQILSEENHMTMAIPEGFAHGFQTLTQNCEMLYFHSAAYRPESERGINPLDPILSIAWPMTISEISSRDASQPMLDSLSNVL